MGGGGGGGSARLDWAKRVFIPADNNYLIVKSIKGPFHGGNI